MNLFDDEKTKELDIINGKRKDSLGKIIYIIGWTMVFLGIYMIFLD